jgi:hypothetical protein
MNYWIITKHDYMLHHVYDKALAEAKRLSEKTGEKFHIYRIKEKLIFDVESGTATPVLSKNKEQIA